MAPRTTKIKIPFRSAEESLWPWVRNTGIEGIKRLQELFVLHGRQESQGNVMLERCEMLA